MGRMLSDVDDMAFAQQADQTEPALEGKERITKAVLLNIERLIEQVSKSK